MQRKKLTAFIISAVMVLSSVSAYAEWISAGYDTTDLDNIGKIYNEVISGNYTSKSKIDSLNEESIVWKNEGFELSYLHAGYDRLYLEGNKQLITRYNNLFPQWETRFVDYFWELYGEHRIYQRQQTKISNIAWRWDYGENPNIDSKLFVPTTRNASVKESFKIYGVGPYDLNGNFVSSEVAAMYEKFGVNNEIFNVIPKTKEIAENTFFHNKNLSQLDSTGHFIVTDEEIADNAGSIVSKFLTGPSFRNDPSTKDVAAEYLKHGDVWQWDADTVKYGGGSISWTNPLYEMQEPYNMYQYLIINGLVFDGRNDLPRIYRYTGGKATPKVEWKYAFAELDYPHQMIEFKYVDGKVAIDEATGNPIYRMSTGQYANSYIKSTDTEVQVWLKDSKADVLIARVPRTSTTGYYHGYTNSSNLVSN